MAKGKGKGKAKAEVEFTRDELVSLAGEMNEVMGLDPKIKIAKSMTEEDIQNLIIEQATGQVFTTDFEDEEEGFSEEAADLFKRLGVEILEPGVEEEEEEEEEEEDSEEEEEEEEKPTKGKGKGKAEKPAKGKGKSEKEEKKAKAKPEPRYTRHDAFAEGLKNLKNKGTIEELATAANEAYIKAGNADNMKEARWHANIVVKANVALGLFNDEDGVITKA